MSWWVSMENDRLCLLWSRDLINKLYTKVQIRNQTNKVNFTESNQPSFLHNGEMEGCLCFFLIQLSKIFILIYTNFIQRVASKFWSNIHPHSMNTSITWFTLLPRFWLTYDFDLLPQLLTTSNTYNFSSGSTANDGTSQDPPRSRPRRLRSAATWRPPGWWSPSDPSTRSRDR